MVVGYVGALLTQERDSAWGTCTTYLRTFHYSTLCPPFRGFIYRARRLYPGGHVTWTLTSRGIRVVRRVLRAKDPCSSNPG